MAYWQEEVPPYPSRERSTPLKSTEPFHSARWGAVVAIAAIIAMGLAFLPATGAVAQNMPEKNVGKSSTAPDGLVQHRPY